MTKIIAKPDPAHAAVLESSLLLVYIRWTEFIPGSEGRGDYQPGIAGKRSRKIGSVIFL